MMELEIVYIDPHELTPYENNTRKHTPEDIDQIKASIEADGFNDPIGVWGENNLIVEGHGRQIAALEMGLDKVPCIRLDHLTETQRRDYAIRHNRTAELSGWDFAKLEEEIAALEIEGVDLSGLKFEFDSVQDDFTDAKTEFEQDEIPDAPEEAITKRGDIWQLGNHILMCGDSTDANDIAKLMNGEKAKMLFTSPPYSDMREYEGGKDLSVSNLAQFISAYRPYTDYQCVNLGIQRKNNDIYEYWDEYIRVARESGYKLLAWNVWDKGTVGSIGNERAFCPIRHEWVFVFGTDFYETNRTIAKKEKSIGELGKKTKRNADGSLEFHSNGDTTKPFKRMESILTISPVLDHNLQVLHPASFPVDLPGEYIKAMSDKDDIIIEPFGGSGTTLIACEVLNRRCRIMELEPKYCDVIIERFENFTGLDAVLLNG